ncbi:MAG: hypothetical protein HXX80_06825 [Nitrososphaerales archaeon]|nr:hypothetical protein [Nitrososphaerales archaeon]
MRVIKVGGVDYLQIVEYIRQPDGKYKVGVIKSFGKDSLENRMKAERFAAEYDRLKNLAKEYASAPKKDQRDFLQVALAVFGIILGVAVVMAILKEIFGE